MMDFRAHRVNTASGLVPFYLPKGLIIEEGEYDITIQKARRRRSLQENAMLHALCQAIGKYTGHSIDEIKLLVKIEAISAGYPYTTVRGVIIPKRSRDADTKECAILIDAAQRIGAELGIDTGSWPC
jgi:hypothetical protein